MTERDARGGQVEAAAHEAVAHEAGASAPPVPSMTAWGRRAALIYLGVGAIALLAMLVETLLGHPGTGTMFAAILGVPWSMLVAGLAPRLPADLPLVAGLALRMVPLALFMLLNAAIIAGIAARSERDLTGRGARAVALVLIAGALSSGCGLTSKQVVLLAAPASTSEVFNGGVLTTDLRFDLTTDPTWNDHRGDIQRVTDMTLMADFINTTSELTTASSVPMSVEIAIAPVSEAITGDESAVWGPLHLEPDGRHRVDWNEGMATLKPDADELRHELLGDGQFTLIARSIVPVGTLGGATVVNFRLGAVLQAR